MVIDGAMGTAIQRDRPDEAGYRGDRFTEWPTALQGNNDLLTLTQPQIIEGIHREYLEAGADILETNTFNANAVSLSDYDMAELAYELNYAGAALARKAADEFSTPEKPRYVAGAIGPDDADRVDLAGRQRPRRPQRLLRPAGRRLPRSRQRPGRRWCRPPHHRDDLRLAERQGGGVRRRDAVRGARPPLAGDHLGHHHRCLRADAVRSGHRGVLERDQAREADRGRPQLRPGRAGDEALHRRGGADRGHLRLLLPERRPAQRLRRVRRVPGAAGRLHRRVRRGRPGQPGRWLLRNGAAAHRRDRQGRRGASRSARCRRSRWPPGSRAWSRSTSPTTPCS